MTEECEVCGKPATWIVRTRVMLEEIVTGKIIEHPSEPYEENLMTESLCNECAIANGYDEEEIEGK